MAERLAELANPTPDDVDIEDIADGAKIGGRGEDSEDEYAADDFYSGLVTEPSRLRKSLGIDMVANDPKYKGVTVSRKGLGSDNDSSEEDDEAGGLEFDVEDGSDEEDLDDEGDSEKSDVSDDEMNEEDGVDEIDEEERKLREELESIQQEEDSTDIVAFTRTNVDEEATKGEHTLNQLRLLDSIIESRIRLQQSLNLCNRLPQHDIRPLFLERGGHELEEVAGAVAATTSLLDSLLELQEACLERSADAAVKTAAQKRKRPHGADPERYWKYMKSVGDSYVPYRNAVLTKWHNKTTLSSGGLSMNKQLKAINQSVLVQVEHVLADREKLMQRTQLKRVPIRPLGKIDKTDGVREVGEEIDKRENPDNYDVEIFDDNDLYHQLLRDLIAARSKFSEGDDPTMMAQTWLEVHKLKTKLKKKVDTKASKGRKIRYTVMPELVNFMFPVEKGTSDDATRTELCRSLFSSV